MSRAGPRVVVLGDVMLDVVAVLDAPFAPGSDAPARVATHGGGSAANVAAWLARTRVPVALVGRVGDDAAGRQAAAELRALGVEAHLAVDRERATGTCVVLVEPGGERSMLPDAGANAGLAAGDLPEALLAPGRHLHVAGYALLRTGSREAARAAIARALAHRMTVSVDPSSAAPLAAAGAAAFLGWASGAGLLLPNADEVAVLAGEEDPQRAARELAAAAGAEVVVTLGAGGALWTDGTRVERSAAVRVAGRADTTGAGDAFTAGLLAARLAGERPRRALAAGNRLAAEAVASRGGRPPHPLRAAAR